MFDKTTKLLDINRDLFIYIHNTIKNSNNEKEKLKEFEPILKLVRKSCVELGYLRNEIVYMEKYSK